MRPFTTALAAASLLVGLLALETPAQAYKALQYRAQGHGRYVYSNGVPKRYGHGHSLSGRHHHQHRRHRGY